MNTQLFNSPQQSTQTATSKVANVLNNAGGVAYELAPKQALAQLVSTGTLNHTFYVDAKTQFEDILALATQVDSEFLAKLAVYARKQSRMKDTPVLLLALLSTRQDGQDYFKQAFNHVIDNGKQLRNFVQIMRSGKVGRRSLGSLPKKMVNAWLNDAGDYRYISATIGTKPRLADVLKMTHPKPADAQKEALFRWTLGHDFEQDNLPERAKQLIAFQKDNTQPLPDVPFQLLMGLSLTSEHWVQIAKQGSFQMVRMNLNTFARHGVFETDGMTKLIADKLTDAKAIADSGVYPYQLYTTWASLDASVPAVIKDSLAQAMELALTNVPTIAGNVVIAVDTSGSMSSPVTGYRRGATSVVRCIDASALFASAIKRVNPKAKIMAFDTDIYAVGDRLDTEAEADIEDRINSQGGNATLIEKIRQNKQRRKLARQRKKQFGNTFGNASEHINVMQLASELASLGGGGTMVSLPLIELNRRHEHVDVMIYFSDNESWVDTNNRGFRHRESTRMMQEWHRLKKRCPNAKLICVDIQPNRHTQAQEREDVLNIGGFGDEVFRIIDLYCQDKLSPEHWLGEIDNTVLVKN